MEVFIKLSIFIFVLTTQIISILILRYSVGIMLECLDKRIKMLGECIDDNYSKLEKSIKKELEKSREK